MKFDDVVTEGMNESALGGASGFLLKNEQGRTLVDSVSTFKAMGVQATDEPRGNREIEDGLRVTLLQMLEDVRSQFDAVASAEGASPEVKKMIEEGQQTLAAVRESCTSGRLDAGRAASTVQGLLALSARATALSAAGSNAAVVDGAAERTAKLRASTAALYEDLFEKDVLRDSLRFDSAEDQREYEKRQRERQQQIRVEQAKATPEGDRNALLVIRDQLSDAKDHGAANSPEFSRLDRQTDALLRESNQPFSAKSAPEVPKDELADAIEAFRTAGVSLPDQTSSINSTPKATVEGRQR